MSNDPITRLLKENRRFEPSADFVAHARIASREAYDAIYRESLDNPDAFWKRETKDLAFRTPWTQTLEWSTGR